MKIHIVFSLSFLFSISAFTQEEVLEKYISEGLENNLALKMKQDDYHTSLSALKEAKGLFFPDVSLNARYSVAGGGRMIEFPVGDLLNPVYATLNQLTLSNMFPAIENQEFTFLRPQEHETKIRLTQPIFNMDIYYNRKINESLVHSEKAGMETYRRALVAEIKTAWYNHLKAIQVHKILINTSDLLDENLRVNLSLHTNDKVTIDAVYRSEAELGKLNQQIAEAEKAVATSAAYFNFLLNRDLMLPVEIGEAEPVEIYNDRDQALYNALFVREEIKMLDAFSEAATTNLKMKKANHLPELVAIMDYGFQGTKYQFTGDDDFYMASLILRWDIFKGLTNRSQIARAKIALEKIEKQKEETNKTIQLQVINAWYDLHAAQKNIPAAEGVKKSSEQAFRIINRKYTQGQASLIEFMDARNTLTNAETALVIATYDYLISFSEFERAAGLYELR